MGTLEFTVGSARSGKSTFSKQWEKDHLSKGSKCVVLNEDMIRLAHHGERYNNDCEPFIHAASQLFLKTLYLAGYHILYDETNTSVNSIVNIFKVDNMAKPYIFLEPLSILEERARDTNQEDLINYGVLKRHCGQIFRLSRYQSKRKPGTYKVAPVTISYGDGIASPENIVTVNDYTREIIYDCDYIDYTKGYSYTVLHDYELYEKELARDKEDFIQKIKDGIRLIRIDYMNGLL